MAGSKLNTWLRGHMDSLPFRKPSEARPPYLSSPRPRVLTPSSSTEVLTQLPSCALFTKVPALVRREMFIIAFGNHTLHVDLTFDYPHFPPPEQHMWDTPAARGQRRHAGIYAPERDYAGPSPKAWHWRACVCHDCRVWRPVYQYHGRYARIGLSRDRCLDGRCHACRDAAYSRAHKWPDDCYVGVMGFLLSCRQA